MLSGGKITSDEELYANVDGKSLILKSCSFESEDKFKEVFLESIKQLERKLGRNLRVCGSEIFMPIEGLAMDLLLIDEEGTPIIVEAKMSFNREIRRMVLGQLFEYMALSYLYPDIIVEACNNIDDPELLNKVKEKISNKEIIGIIASDRLPDIVRYTIEIFNSGLERMSIYGFELSRYCNEEENTYVVVSNLVGRTAESASTGKERKTKTWPPEELIRYFDENIADEKLRGRLKELLEWALNNDVFLESQAIKPTFGLKVRATGGRVITVSSNGWLDICYGINCKDSYKSEEDRYRLYAELIKLGLIEENATPPNEQPYTKRTKSIAILSAENFHNLLEILQSILV